MNLKPSPFLAPLNWLGRHGTRAAALSIVIGLLVPVAAALIRPYLQVIVFALMVLAYLRVDTTAIRRRMASPLVLLLSTGFLMLVIPVLGILLLRGSGLAEFEPQVFLILIIVATAPPVMSAPAFAFLMGLDGTLSVAVLLGCMVVTPITAPIIASMLPGLDLLISPWDLAFRLSALLAGSLLISLVIRTLVGPARIQASGQAIDGMSVVMLFIFALAAMDGVGARLVSEPALVLGLAAASFAVALGQLGLTYAAFRGAGRLDAFTIGMAAGNRNMAIMVAALGGAIPDLTWLYFAVGQFPIYLLPYILHPIVRRITNQR